MTEITKPAYLGDRIRWSYIKKYLPKREGGKLLDAGAGNCEFRSLCESKGYKYHAIDINPNSPAQRADVCNIPFPSGEFDVIISVDVLEHVEDDKKAVREFYRVLKDDGILILHVPSRGQKHILIEKPEEQHDHVRDGYDALDLHTLFFEFSKCSYYPTFDKIESIAWDLFFAVTHKIPINPLHLIDEEKWNEWRHYGGILIAKK